MRLVRSRAIEWGVDPNRVGILGFSAGGEVASLVAYTPSEAKPDAADPVDRLSAKANFQIMIYPGPLGLPETVPADAPPVLFIAANDDRQPARSIATMLARYQAANVPIEVHLFARGGHAFGLGTRTKLASVKNWPERMKEWLLDSGLLTPVGEPKAP